MDRELMEELHDVYLERWIEPRQTSGPSKQRSHIAKWSRLNDTEWLVLVSEYGKGGHKYWVGIAKAGTHDPNRPGMPPMPAFAGNTNEEADVLYRGFYKLYTKGINQFASSGQSQQPDPHYTRYKRDGDAPISDFMGPDNQVFKK